MSAGANAYLTKPLNVKEFLRVLDETLAQEK
jgi:DNA-binding response OmpR family regulator